MKKYVFLVIMGISVVTISCTSDNEIQPISKSKNDYYLLQKDSDSSGIDTGGQGGTTPVKPPKP